ncbi:MAG: peptidoglycan-binding protein [bacterium]|nr:peptidoglycan-binding protein [bacterium]
MENFKTTLLVAVAILIVGSLGYWAFSTIDSGSEYSKKQKEQKIVKENNLSEPMVPLDSVSEATGENTNPVPEANLKHQVLIGELQGLIDDNINMKLKSRGTRVGTVQNFLNIYNGTTNKLDNSYGEGMKKLVTAFQSATGLPATGDAGPSDFMKMIEWLKNQG